MTLFGIDPLSVGTTTDEWYTPPWVFKPADVMFDLDVCAPLDPLCRTVPARQHLTVAEDGLSWNWCGLIWCNPPYSRAAPWVARWAAHRDGLLLVPAVPEVRWLGVVLGAADGLTVVSCDFIRPTGAIARLRWPCILASRGDTLTTALSRIARADAYAEGNLLVRRPA